MTHDVTDQLLAYRDSVEAALAELDEQDDIIVDLHGARRSSGWYWLVAVAAALLMIVGIAVGQGVLGDDAGDVITNSRDSVPVDPVESIPADTAPTPSTPEVTNEPQLSKEDQPSAAVEWTSAVALTVPESGETQQTVIGDITWTLVEGDSTTQPVFVIFALDGYFYGLDPDPLAAWWRSPDGLTWSRGGWWHSPDGIVWAETSQGLKGHPGRIFEVGDETWATDVTASASSVGLIVWNGASFVPVDLSVSTTPDIAGVVAHRSDWQVVGFGSEIVIYSRTRYEPGGEVHDELLIGDADGFESMALPLPPGLFNWLYAVDDRLFAVNQSRRTRANGTLFLNRELWTSADARTWEQVELPIRTGEDINDDFSISSTDEGMFLIVPDQSNVNLKQVWRTTDGETWQTLEDRYGTAEFGLFRAGEPNSVIISADGIIWQEISIEPPPRGEYYANPHSNTIFFTGPFDPDGRSSLERSMWVGTVNDD